MRPNVEWAARLDEEVNYPDHFEAFQPRMGAWSRTIREAIGVPMSSLGKRRYISKQAVSRLEQSEAARTISIEKLEAMANALDCDLIYGFIPRKSFADTAERLQKQQDR